MDMIFEYLQQDMNLMLAVAVLCAAVAFVALWKVITDLRGAPPAGSASSASAEPVAKADGSTEANP